MPDAKPKTCCGACIAYVGGAWFYHLVPKFPGGQRAIFKVNFCPECGAYLPPNGDKPERRGEVVGEAVLVTREGRECAVFSHPIASLASDFVQQRVLLVLPAEEEPEEAPDAH